MIPTALPWVEEALLLGSELLSELVRYANQRVKYMVHMVGETQAFLTGPQTTSKSTSPTSVSEMATWWDSMVGLRQARGEM